MTESMVDYVRRRKDENEKFAIRQQLKEVYAKFDVELWEICQDYLAGRIFRRQEQLQDVLNEVRSSPMFSDIARHYDDVAANCEWAEALIADPHNNGRIPNFRRTRILEHLHQSDFFERLTS